MSHYRMPLLNDTGFAILSDIGTPVPPDEWEQLEFMHWKSGGDTRFAPIASAYGEMECRGFWDHGKPDKGGIWTKNADVCPSLVAWAKSPGARFGRVRVIELQPNAYEDAVRNLHLDDNNRLNPDGEGRVVRAWLELTDNRDSFMVVREDKDDPFTESHIPLHAGAQYVVDTERLWHAVCHPGEEARYALIVSWESGPCLEDWMLREGVCESQGVQVGISAS